VINQPAGSPRWTTRTKSLVAAAAIVLVAALLIRFRNLVSPLILAFILAYLLNPVVVWIMRRSRMPRRVVVGIIYLILVLLLLSILGGVGFLIQQQMTGLISGMQDLIRNIPQFLREASARPIMIGPYTVDLSTIDLTALEQPLVGSAQQMVSTLAGSVTGAASSALQFLGWVVFILAVSYYLLHDMYAVEMSVMRIVPPPYRKDAERLISQLGPIWNSFLRGQAILALVMSLAVGLTMSALGLRYSLVIGITAGLVEFVPIIGPLANGIAAVAIALFQPTNWLGLTPLAYAIVIAVVAIALQQLENNLLVPRIIGNSVGLHPVVVIVGALVGASLAGIAGLLLAAPILATLKGIGRYLYAKMFDLPPWPDAVEEAAPAPAAATPPPAAKA
jgi:predicted PurR-regulated permease PerM